MHGCFFGNICSWSQFLLKNVEKLAEALEVVGKTSFLFGSISRPRALC